MIHFREPGSPRAFQVAKDLLINTVASEEQKRMTLKVQEVSSALGMISSNHRINIDDKGKYSSSSPSPERIQNLHNIIVNQVP